MNVRGFADAYEFDEDRISLEEDKAAGKALCETVRTLEKEFGPALLQKGICVQGLIAFSALAIDEATGQSTIHSDRAKDLGRVQTRYLDTFGSAGDMLRFSQIDAVAKVLSIKSLTFKQDIIESNKRKVVELVSLTLLELQCRIDLWNERIAQDAPIFAACYQTVSQVGESFAKSASKKRQIVWTAFFQNLQIDADAAIAKHFGDPHAIRSALEHSQTALLEKAGAEWRAWIADTALQLDVDLVRATTRLAEDLVQTDMQLKLTENLGQIHAFNLADLAMDLSLKDLGGFAVDIGAYALSGAAIGTEFPVIGNLIGLIAGAAVGLVKVAVSYFSGKGDRIRAVQQKLHVQIAQTSTERLEALKTLDRALGVDVTRAIDVAVTSRVKAVEAKLARVPFILEKQFTALKLIRKNVEDMPHGSIHAIRD